MANGLDVAAPLPSIIALSPTTVRQIGSSQVLIDPSSVVRELIDNALDARAAAIFVDISSNTIDNIQVKDTGHGIPQEDRPLACRRYCTSKLRDFHDLKEVGGKWLGFRGEAMASMAEMSGLLEVTTRVEGEPVAVKLKYGRNGELVGAERASAPVGTTVKVTDFFKYLPVRKQASTKDPSKCLAKVRRLIQAYALARPAVRFGLRVLNKAKSNNIEFMYAPKKHSNVEDAILKVISRDCALQYGWTALKTDGFEFHVSLPKPDAVGSKIANEGAFVSVDARPVSATRGILRKVVLAFKERLRWSNPKLRSVKDPFFCMNIICPPNSYDPNIEPAKDDVLFEEGEIVLAAVDKLLASYYPKAIIEVDEVEALQPPKAAQEQAVHKYEESPKRSKATIFVHEDTLSRDDDAKDAPESSTEQPQWRSSMYGIDEEDLAFLNDKQAPVIEEEEGRRAIAVSNPWTIALMNTRTKNPINNGQLKTPAKLHGDASIVSSSPLPATSPRQLQPCEPLTPQTSSRSNIVRPCFEGKSRNGTQRLSPSASQDRSLNSYSFEPSVPSNLFSQTQRPLSPSPLGAVTYSQAHHFSLTEPRSGFTGSYGSFTSAMNTPDLPLDMMSSSSPAPRRNQRKQKPRHNCTKPSGEHLSNDDWFDQPVRGQAPSKHTRQQKPKRTQNPHVDTFPQNDQKRLYSENNTDIRNFFGQGKTNLLRSASPGPCSSTPINGRPRALCGKRPVDAGKGEPGFLCSSKLIASHDLSLRANLEPCEKVEQFRKYAGREGLTRASSAESFLGPNPNLRTSPMPATRSRARDNLAAQLRSYKEREKSSPSLQTSTSWILPRNSPPPEISLARPARPQTMDGMRRRRSSRVPPERVPQQDRIQNLKMRVSIGVSGMMDQMRKINMGTGAGNSIKWGCSANELSYDIFGSSITDGCVKLWTASVVRKLERMYERSYCADTDVQITEGICERLRNRREEEEAGTDLGAQERINAWTKQVSTSHVAIPSIEHNPASHPQKVHVTKPNGNCIVREDSPEEFGDGLNDADILDTRNDSIASTENADNFADFINVDMFGASDEQPCQDPTDEIGDGIENDEMLLDF